MSATTSTTPAKPETKPVPKSVVLPDDLPRTIVCPGCGVKVPAAKVPEHFFLHRASGGYYVGSKHGCRTAEKVYRDGLAANENREVKPRKVAEEPEPAKEATAKEATAKTAPAKAGKATTPKVGTKAPDAPKTGSRATAKATAKS